MKYILGWLTIFVIILACKGLGTIGINVPEFLIGLFSGSVSMGVVDIYEFYDKEEK